MKRYLLLSWVLLSPAHADEINQTALAADAQAAAQALGGALKAELEAALQAGGPVEALGVCQIKAPAIAERISAEKALKVSRTSLKPRNPQNAPNAWQTKVLRDFEARKAAGEDPAKLVYSEVADQEFRYMKAIPTAPVCLTCHGEQLAPAVSAKLAELYPQDRATGYREGDLRGAFVVVKDLSR
ncbi:DUF3365 domain-containing protein [Methylococcus sp. Mc7]|uniref:Tll0287-like domain-containing protein n=1 Tax=Methylococcus sp. Mc7 TaxID=2860258 RepID=UPI001C52B23D|nr:DUF3365 domain-containing protein [Methylococcus sp. Mc7]QXP83903.1 DUF3365 domain-containing protein [Methylococcus sp. Mc7]